MAHEMTKEAEMFSFSKTDGWKEIEDFLQTPGIDDCEKEREAAGFTRYRALAVGDTDAASFCVEVFNREFSRQNPKEPQYEYLVSIDVGGNGNYVAVPKLPDLLALLQQVIPLSISIDEWSIMKEKYNDKLEKEISSKSALRK
jgi:hypothetical protein